MLAVTMEVGSKGSHIQKKTKLVISALEAVRTGARSRFHIVESYNETGNTFFFALLKTKCRL
jgi:hypothetical protein